MARGILHDCTSGLSDAGSLAMLPATRRASSMAFVGATLRLRRVAIVTPQHVAFRSAGRRGRRVCARGPLVAFRLAVVLSALVRHAAAALLAAFHLLADTLETTRAAAASALFLDGAIGKPGSVIVVVLLSALVVVAVVVVVVVVVFAIFVAAVRAVTY